jgi:hypothetical protein
MYGLVNKAVEDLVRTNFGEETWLKIKAESQVTQETFIGMQSYPDGVTYDLVGAACKVLGASAEQILEAFGEYWVLYTAKEGYGDMLNMAGHTLPEFLRNLDALHVRVGNLMPELRPPSFECEDIADNALHLHYFSDRDGLAPMVVGLVKGLGKRFNTPCTVVQIAHKANGADHDVFSVEW